MPGFLFALCQPGAEAALKAELARLLPDAKPAYSRPGFVTFKLGDADVHTEPVIHSVFARRMGVSLGSCAHVTDAVARAQQLTTDGRPLRLHVAEREPGDAGEPATDDHASAVRAAMLKAAPEGLFHTEARAQIGERVVNVIVAPGEPLWLGVHTQRADQSPWPAGGYPIQLPHDAPSRAYLKLAQALAWSGAPVRAGDQALEIGSAPGGATLALLERGVSVLGVDPGQMDPRVLQRVGPKDARLTHLQLPVGGLKREQLPERVHWLLLDVNLAPQVALRSIQRLVPPLRRHLLGMFLTLKLNDWSMAEQIPKFLEQARRFGLIEPRAVQLPANRQEILLFGLTERGRRR